MADALANELLQRYSTLKAERDSRWMVDWQYISQYYLPQDSVINTDKTPGQVAEWTDQIYDTTPIEAAETLKAGQYNWLTPPNQPWFEFEVPEEVSESYGEDGEASNEATIWLGRATDITRRELSRSNFYSVAGISYLGVGVFGTDFMLCEEGKRSAALNFRHARIGTYVIEEDDEGIVDTTMREFDLTFRQAKQMFGEDSLPKKMANEAKGAEGGRKKFKFLHCIFPRKDSERLPNRKDGANKAIASVYISMDYREVISVSGYDEQPALVSRFQKWGTGDPWGYGPAYLTLPLARQLNYVQQYLDALAELHAYPRVLVPDNLEGDVDLRAGGTTTWDSSNPNGKPEEWATIGEYKLGLDMQEQRREQLRDAFLNKAFKLLNSEPLLDKKMTAYEISQRQAEILGDFTPSFGRRVTEFLNPLLMRVFGILYRQGRFGSPPDSLMQDMGGGKRGLVLPSVVITSRLSDALKALKNRATEETVQFLAPLIETKPEILDPFDWDKIAINYARNSGMSPDEIRPAKGPEGYLSLRIERAKILQEQRQMAAAEQLAAAGKNLGSSPAWMQTAAQGALTG